MKKQWKSEKGTIPKSKLLEIINSSLPGSSSSEEIISNFEETIIDLVAKGYRVRTGLGSFYPVHWETREVELSGEKRTVIGRNIVMYNASKNFKDRVKSLTYEK
ncbi:MAG: HU family DNA-binding protein [Candidatus Woesearchaeota archaeon]|nr:MAG: HU family DNA-binding protein [Candidatus Woesearchaeota archaeon]